MNGYAKEQHVNWRVASIHTKLYGLGSQHHCLHTRGTDFVDIRARHTVRHACSKNSLAAWCLEQTPARNFHTNAHSAVMFCQVLSFLGQQQLWHTSVLQADHRPVQALH